MDDLAAMRSALACAHSVEGRTSPRPPVGAVIVKDGTIIGQGATAPPYGPHAEIQALTRAGQAARGATLYVTLEPCCIHRHTPPCTEAIIAAGIQRVVIGTHDPNPQVHSQGIAQLCDAGIAVTLLEDCQEAQEAQALIRPFAVFITRNRPYVTAKWAMTLDGKIAARTGDAFWISGPDARSWVHNLRDSVDAILIGAGTARMDNPQLTVRLAAAQSLYKRAAREQEPLRVILSSNGLLSPDLTLLNAELAQGTCIIVGETTSKELQQRLTANGAEVLPVAVDSTGQVDIELALSALAQRGIMHILLEGGMRLFSSVFDRYCIDHVAAFIAPKLLGGGTAPTPLAGKGLPTIAQAYQLQNVHTTLFQTDILIEGDIYNESIESSEHYDYKR